MVISVSGTGERFPSMAGYSEAKKKKPRPKPKKIKPRRKETDGQDVEKLEPLSIHIGQFKWGSH